jgi:hypothetical protein
VTRVSTNPADPQGSVGQVGHAAAGNGSGERDPDLLVDGPPANGQFADGQVADADGAPGSGAPGNGARAGSTAAPERPQLVEPTGPIERFMGRLIRRLAWSRLSRPRVAIAVSGVGLLLGMLVGALAPNSQTLQLRLPLSNYLPKLFGLRDPDTIGLHNIIAAVMLYSGDILACLGLAGMLWAHSQGWRPDPRKLLLASTGIVAIMVCLTPIGSSDTASYAAYGRIAALGGNPYSSSALSMPALGGPRNPLPGTYAYVVGWEWHHQPSVYGPVATWLQRFAASIGGASVTHTIWVLMIINGLVFLGIGLFLLKTSDDPVRATLFWTANPVLILELVGGGHFDTLVAACAIGAIQVARKMPNVRGDLLVGLLIGIGCGVKITMGLVAIGLAWPLLMRREWARLTRITLVAMAVTALELSYYGPDALKPMFEGSQWVTLPSPLWFFQLIWLHLGFPHHGLAEVTAAKAAMAPYISIIWITAMFIVAWLVYQRISSDQPREVVAPFALTYSWVVVAPWVFAWYTALPWVVLTQVPRNRMSRWLAIVTVVLALWHSSGGWVPPGRV